MTTTETETEKKEEGEEGTTKELDESEKLVRKILFLRNPFDQLGVAPETSNDAARRAFRRLALRVHPDRCRCAGATEAAMALSRALAVVTDAEQRKPYVELTVRARQHVRDAWARAGRPWRTRRPKEGDGDDNKNSSNSNTTAAATGGNDDEDEDDDTAWAEDPEYVYEVQRAVHTMILQIEARDAAAKRVAEVEAEHARAEEAREQQRVRDEQARDHRWERQRDLRVRGWRAFQQQQQPAAKRARPLRPPPLVREARPAVPSEPPRHF